MPTITIAGTPLFYEVYDQRADVEKHGDVLARPPLVLIHGAGGTYLHWPSHLRRLPDQLVYALDLPGHGRSGGSACDSIAAYGQVISAVLDSLAISVAVVGGHSMGGAIALELALTAPQRVAGLVLVSTGARLRVNPAIIQGLQSDFATTTAQLIDWMYSPDLAPDQRARALQQLRANPPQQLVADFRACDHFDCRADLSAIKQPTLISCGTHDQMTPVNYSNFLHQSIAGSELHLLEEGSHMAMIERPAHVIAAVRAFLTKPITFPQH